MLIIRMLAIVILSLGWISSGAIAATCSGNIATASMLPLVLNPAENGGIGTVLGTQLISVNALNYTCGSNIKTRLTSTYTRGNSLSALPDVYNTEIGGVGIRIKWPVSRATAYLPTIQDCQSPCTINKDDLLIEFVQTGKVIAGDIPLGEIAEVVLTAAEETSNSVKLLSVVLVANTSVVVRSCMIANSNLNIDLGSYPLSDFNTGNKHGNKIPFSISVYCPQESSVKIAFTTVEQQPVGSSRGVIQNTIPVESGGAKGIGTRMLTENGVIPQQVDGTVSSKILVNADEHKDLKYSAQIYIVDTDRKNITSGNISGQVYFNLTIE
ncbi:fimbrial protein [Yersinia hibernica]|uniref:Type 1 fimbrial protein n=1 Tax=Yersinia hibernica TaxID=2339259 RepID=A0ABX5QZT3_9GAMM|nr:fimbrial protein [Yersinia hibernica]QAX78618.1 type 1 fimbrial protein [Yersinia hibernica]